MSDLRMELIQGQLNDIEENVRSIKATWGNTIMTLDNSKSSLKVDRQKAIEEAYQKGYDEAKLIYQNPNAESDYQRGLDDGRNETWDVAKKIALMDTETSENVTGYFGLFRIMDNLTASEAIAKLKGLIDADKLMRDIEEYHLSDGKFQHWVEVQQTIIEAERSEE